MSNKDIFSRHILEAHHKYCIKTDYRLPEMIFERFFHLYKEKARKIVYCAQTRLFNEKGNTKQKVCLRKRTFRIFGSIMINKEAQSGERTVHLCVRYRCFAVWVIGKDVTGACHSFEREGI